MPRHPAKAPSRPQPKKEPVKRPNPARPVGLDVMAEKVARYPEVALLRNELGNLLVESGRLEEAVTHYRKAVKLEPGFATAWNNLGVAMAGLGRHNIAIAAYRKAIKAVPAYALAYYNLGAAYDARGRYTRAVASYQKAIELDPGLLDLRQNPQVASNRNLAAVLIGAYLDRGGSVVLPVQSYYPTPPATIPGR